MHAFHDTKAKKTRLIYSFYFFQKKKSFIHLKGKMAEGRQKEGEYEREREGGRLGRWETQGVEEGRRERESFIR